MPKRTLHRWIKALIDGKAVWWIPFLFGAALGAVFPKSDSGGQTDRYRLTKPAPAEAAIEAHPTTAGAKRNAFQLKCNISNHVANCLVYYANGSFIVAEDGDRAHAHREGVLDVLFNSQKYDPKVAPQISITIDESQHLFKIWRTDIATGYEGMMLSSHFHAISWEGEDIDIEYKALVGRE